MSANSDLVKSRIRNYARMSERRIVFRFGIEHNQAAEKVACTSEIAREAIDDEKTRVSIGRTSFRSVTIR